LDDKTTRRVAVVTGAAKGIGAAISRRLVRENYAVAAIDIDQSALGLLCNELTGNAFDVLPIVGDLAEFSFVCSISDRVAQHFGRIDLLVNNAAWRELATMRDIDLDSWERTLRIGLTAPAFLSREAAKHMEATGGGVIVNIGSVMAQQAAGYAPAYIASKGALASLTYDLAALYGPHGIRVVGINLGSIDSGLSQDLAVDSSPALAEIRNYTNSMAMLGRSGSADEVASAVAWVASGEASYLTGTIMTLDGGLARHHLPSPLANQVVKVAK
jgi:3-oxoacyl-[acyl-carrier protein] reductase